MVSNNSSSNSTNNNKNNSNKTKTPKDIFEWAQKTVYNIIKTRKRSIELSKQVVKLTEDKKNLKKKTGLLKLQIYYKDEVIDKLVTETAQLKRELKKQNDIKKTKEEPKVPLGSDMGLDLKVYPDGPALVARVKPFLDTLFK